MRKSAFLTLVMICLSLKVFAATPQVIDYQGYLMEGGVAVTGTKSVNFALYDSLNGGTQHCSTGAQSLTVSKGVFSYGVGDGDGCDLSTIDFDNPVYLELSVEGTALSPREQIAGAAYSVHTKAINVKFNPAGGIAATDAQTAIEELDAEKLSLSGGTMTGALTVKGAITSTSNISAASGTVIAQAFSGNGSALTSVTPADNTVTSAKVSDNTLTAADLAVNVVSSVDGVTNDGGNVDLVAGGGISIVADDAANTITFTAVAGAVDHNSLSNLTVGNPHTQYVLDAGDTMTGDLNVNADVLVSGDVTAATGTITANAFVGDGTGITGVAATGIADNTITSAKIVDATIVTADLADSSVTSAKIVDATVATADLAANSVTSAKIVDGTIVSADIADGTVASADITDLTVATGDVAFEFVGSIEGVANKGGDIDLVAGGGISIVADDTANTITLSAVAGAVDHNSLSNLTTGDVHTQYVLDAGDTMSGTLNMGNNPVTNIDWSTSDDGAGSGLDADLLDGLTSSDFVATATAFGGDVSGNYSNVQIGSGAVGSAEIADGAVASADITDLSVATGDVAFEFVGSVDGVANKGGDVDFVAGAGITITPSDGANTITFTADASAVDHNSLSNLTTGDVHTQYVLDAGDTMSGTLNMGNNPVTNIDWSASDDGAGSGLDADLLDGQEGAYYLNTGTAHGGDVSGAYNNIQIAADAVTAAEIATGAVGTSEIADGSVASADIADGAIATADLAADSVTSAKIVDGTIVSADIADGTVASADITDLSVATGDVAFEFVGSVDGVANKGGDVDFVAGAGITITPSDGANTITFTADASAVDHNSLSNLTTGDVHTQYVLDAGDTMSGTLNMGNNPVTNIDWSTSDDGAGSGLDADLLDGQEGAYYMPASTDNWVNTSGDNMTGNLNVNADILVSGDITAATGTITANAFVGDGTGITGVAATGISDNTITSAKIVDGAIVTADLADSSVTSAKIVDGTIAAADISDGATLSEIADDDGAGSGLDADLLDGQEGAYYMPASTDNWVNTSGDNMTGNLNVNADILVSGDITAATGTITANAFVGDGTGITGVAATGISDNTITSAKIVDGAIVTADLADSSVTSAKIVDGTIAAADISDGATLAEIADDDGAGSGLDADLLDGQQGSYYVADGCTDCLNATEIEDIYVQKTGDTMTGSLSIARTDSSWVTLAMSRTGFTTVAGFNLQVESSAFGDRMSFARADSPYTRYLTVDGVNSRIGINDVMNPSTALEVNGTVTATAFSGSGASLTGVAATSIADNTITSAKIVDGAVGSADLTDGATLAEIADDDGTGSGLDADLLDGQHATYFVADGCTDCLNATEIEDIYLLTTGDDMTGPMTITLNSASAGLSTSQTGTGNGGSFSISNATNANSAVYGSTNGTGVAGYFQKTNATNGNATVYSYAGGTGSAVYGTSIGAGTVISGNTSGNGTLYGGDHTGGSGNLVQLKSGGATKFTVTKAGDVTATSFSGDGSALTNITAGSISHNSLANLTTGDPHTQYILAAGDSMTGALVISQSAAAASLSVTQTNSTNHSGYFAVNNASSNQSGVYGTTNGTSSSSTGVKGVATAGLGVGVYGQSAGYFGIYGTTSAGGYAGIYGSASWAGVQGYSNGSNAMMADAASTAVGLRIRQSGTGNMITGTNNVSTALFQVDYNGNITDVGSITSDGIISTGVNNASSGVSAVQIGSGDAVYGYNSGTGRAGYFRINNAANTDRALYVTTNSNAGRAGDFSNTNASSSVEALFASTAGSGSAFWAYTTGTGKAGYFQISNAGNSSALIYGTTSGTGNLIQLAKSGADKFVVDNDGVITAGCPPTSMVDAGSYCIDTDESAADTWSNAASACVAAGKRLCSPSEWKGACDNYSTNLLNETGNWEWVDNIISASNRAVYGNGGCSNINTGFTDATANAYRCCSGKVQ